MISGVINVLKVPGMSSGGAVGRIKYITGEKRAGHTGTLDPAAAGVLPICIGRATRLSDIIMDHEKEYIAEACFGASTDTLDAAGKILQRSEMYVSREAFLSVLPDFTGNIVQLPPIYSAIKINGKKAYELARKGRDFELEKRTVNVRSVEFLSETDKNRFLIKVRCSKGTYIRTLIADIGEKLGVPAYTSVLIRSECGGMRIEDALETAEMEEMAKNGDMSFIKKPEDAVLDYKKVVLDESRKFALENGLPTTLDAKDGLYRVYCAEEFYGMGKQQDGELRLTIPLR